MRSALALGALATPTLPAQAPGDWPAYGGNAGGTRYSPLDQITRGNVGQLQLAWVVRTGDYFRDRGRFEANPLVVDGTMYVSTPMGTVVALETGDRSRALALRCPPRRRW